MKWPHDFLKGQDFSSFLEFWGVVGTRLGWRRFRAVKKLEFGEFIT
jgi:hypothetical protein